jgi:phosphatidylglycerol lysyltransferase
VLPEMRSVSDAWLIDKHTSEKGFSLGLFQEDYLQHFPVGIVRIEGKMVAFANLWPGADRQELSVDLMRHSQDAPSGIMDFLFVKLLLWGKQEGYQWFNLGMAPLSGIENSPFTPLWNRLGSFLYGHGEFFYNFQGIRQYKDKFQPDWHPKYLVSPGGLALPQILTNLTSLIAGGLKGVLSK